jgi:hypothetical protein
VNDDDKKRLILLLDELLNTTHSESRQEEINDEISELSPDPFWSDYIFWSEDYINEDGSINYEKFFEKISEYPTSSEYQTKSRIIKLAEQLLSRDFSEINELDAVNEMNSLSPDISWMDYIFADKTCLNSDGSLDKEKFLNQIFDESWNENFR